MEQKLVVDRFRGIKSFILDLSRSSQVRGSNATGKTTLKDNFIWILTGRDGQGRADFEIKTRKGDGVEHQLDHGGEIHEDGWAVKRIYREEWKKKRGESEESMTGHTTDYYISEDGNPFTPVGKNTDKKTGIIGYDDFIKQKVGTEEEISMCVDPMYFAEKMHWKKRREIIMKVTGGETSEIDIAKMIPEFPNLPKLLEGRSASESIVSFKGIVSAIDKQLDELRISKKEASRAIPETTGDKEKVLLLIEEFQRRIKVIDEDIENVTSGAKARENLKKAEKKLEDLIDSTARANKKSKSDYELTRREKESEISFKNKTITRLLEGVNGCKEKIQSYERLFNEVKFEEYEQKEECPTCGVGVKCPHCGETIMDESKAIQNFNADKADRLKRINEKVAEEQRLQEKYEDEMTTEKINLESMKKALEKMVEPKEKIADTAEIEKEIRDLKKAVEGEKEEIDKMTAPFLEKRKTAYEVLADLQGELGVYESADKQRARVKEIEAEQDQLKEKHQTAMKNIFALEGLIKKKVEMAEERVVEKFGIKFKMFERQQNGGLNEVCEPMISIDGEDYIPFSTANNASRITVGLLLCEVLQNFYGKDLPVFIDNAESVVDLPKTGLRVVAMYVDEKYPKLTQI